MLLSKRFGFIPGGGKSISVKIPKEIIGSGEKFINSTIRGIFDTDGCVFLDKRKIYKNIYPRITLQMISKELHEQLKSYLLGKFSLYCAEKDIEEKNRAYYIEVYGIKQLKKWMGLIGFSNKRHLDKVKYALVAQLGRAYAW